MSSKSKENQIQPPVSEIAYLFEGLSDLFRKHSEKQVPIINELKNFEKRWDDFTEIHYPLAIKKLAKFGWYFSIMDYEPWEVKEITDYVDSSNQNEIDHYMKKITIKRIKDIEDKFIKNFPLRKNPFIAALKAHRNGEYLLSVPIFLIQADGIFFEKFHKLKKNWKTFTLYSEDPRKMAIKDSQMVTDIGKMFIRSLKEKDGAIPRFEKFTQFLSGGKKSVLNRHLILHGIDCNYGTEKESLQALSFLDLIQDFVLW